MRLDCAQTEIAFLRKRIVQLEERLELEQNSKKELEEKVGRVCVSMRVCSLGWLGFLLVCVKVGGIHGLGVKSGPVLNLMQPATGVSKEMGPSKSASDFLNNISSACHLFVWCISVLQFQEGMIRLGPIYSNILAVKWLAEIMSACYCFNFPCTKVFTSAPHLLKISTETSGF